MSTEITSAPITTLSKASRTFTQPLSFIKTRIYGATPAASKTQSPQSPPIASPIPIQTAPTKTEPPLREASKEQVYELCTINGSGVYLLPSPDATNPKRDHWHVRQSSDDEPFPSTDRLIMRRSLSDGYPILNFHTPSLSGSRPSSPAPRAQVNEAHRAKHMTWDGVLNEQKSSNARLPIETRHIRSPSLATEEDDDAATSSLSGSLSSSTTSDPLSLLTMEEDDVRRASFPKAVKTGQNDIRTFVPKFKWDTLVQA
jgi:hypothetical protein